jgi:hypothetical protein
MPRQHRQRPLASVLGILALVGAALGPLAAPAWAAPTRQQDGDGPSTAIIVAIDEPTHRSGATATRLNVRGWAANPASPLGTGVARVDLYLDGGPDSGGQYLGRATYGRQRVDVAEALGGSRFLATGWDIIVDIPRGPHTLVAVAAPTGPELAVVIPGVASVRAVVGGPAGRTERGCAAGGYCTSLEGGANRSGNGSASDPPYVGNAYVGYGTYGFGPTTPQYGWWDALLPDLVPYLIAYAASAYPGPQSFFGHTPALYDQNLLTAQSTLGVLGRSGGCSGIWNFGGHGPLGLGVLGGYSYGFPFIQGIGSSTPIGMPNNTPGSPYGSGYPLSVPLSGSTGLGSIFASGVTGAYNGGLTSLGGLFNGSAIGVAGAGGAISSSYGGFYPGAAGSSIGDTFQPGGCTQRL